MPAGLCCCACTSMRPCAAPCVPPGRDVRLVQGRPAARAEAAKRIIPGACRCVLRCAALRCAATRCAALCCGGLRCAAALCCAALQSCCSEAAGAYSTGCVAGWPAIQNCADMHMSLVDIDFNRSFQSNIHPSNAVRRDHRDHVPGNPHTGECRQHQTRVRFAASCHLPCLAPPPRASSPQARLRHLPCHDSLPPVNARSCSSPFCMTTSRGGQQHAASRSASWPSCTTPIAC